jgi:predicted nucleic acid-binding protein
MKNITALVDTNILLDHLLDREPFRANAYTLVNACREGKFNGYIAAHSFPTIFYIMRKDFSVQRRKELLLGLTYVFNIVAVDKARLVKALTDDSFDDIEDYLQYDCAAEAAADYIITRDGDGFTAATIPVVTPEAFLQQIESHDDEDNVEDDNQVEE